MLMALLRRRSQTIIIDGVPYRWRASHRAIMVEHAETPRGRLREFMTMPEAVDQHRIRHLVRHARQMGWRPAEDDKLFALPPVSIWDDPRLRPHYEWMTLLRKQLRRLEAFLGCPVEVGAYWWHGSEYMEIGGLGARLRFGPCRLFTDSDICEAAYCITGIEGLHAYTDVLVFPFRDGDNLGLTNRRFWLLWLKQDCEQTMGIWRYIGAKPWYTPNQWSFATEPGRVFYALAPTTTDISVAEGQPIPVHVSLERPANRTERFFGALHMVEERARGSLVRMGAGDAWFSWEEVDAIELDRTENKVLVHVDLSQLSVSGGWTPGDYQVVMRIRSEFGRGEGQSDITTPIHIEIA